MRIKEATIVFEYTSEEGYVYWVEGKERLEPGGKLQSVFKSGSDTFTGAMRDLREFMKGSK